MFPSPCFFRSAPCATLIALAAAAGISRIEPDLATAAASRTEAHASGEKLAQPLPFVLLRAALRGDLTASFAGHRAEGGPASLLRSHARGEPRPEISALAPAGSWSPRVFAATSPIVFIPPNEPIPAARKHSYPYAVGPPRRGSHPSLHAASTKVPGDSSARRTPVSRIAPISLLIPLAQLMRVSDQGPESARSILSPSSAPRGEPGFIFSPAPHPARSRPHVAPGEALFSA